MTSTAWALPSSGAQVIGSDWPVISQFVIGQSRLVPRHNAVSPRDLPCERPKHISSSLIRGPFPSRRWTTTLALLQFPLRAHHLPDHLHGRCRVSRRKHRAHGVESSTAWLVVCQQTCLGPMERCGFGKFGWARGRMGAREGGGTAESQPAGIASAASESRHSASCEKRAKRSMRCG